MIDPPRWSVEILARDRATSLDLFRESRLAEPLEDYLDEYDDFIGVVEDLLEESIDLRRLEDMIPEVLADTRRLLVVRYLTAPPISSDDLKTVAGVRTLAPSIAGSDPVIGEAVVEVIAANIDRRRFPWLLSGRDPTEAERLSAVVSTTAMIALRKAETKRRMGGKAAQEERVRASLQEVGLESVTTRHVATVADSPEPGQFCSEARLGNRKADFIVRLWDGRIMPIECKVSNSAVNSVKRLNNDAAAKAEAWQRDFGRTQVVPTAVVSGVFELHNLQDAQDRGLALFWGHKLDSMRDWIARTHRREE